MNKMKPIFIALSPNIQKEDVFLALKLLFQPWKWNKGAALEELETTFKQFLGVKHCLLFSSGRAALLAILDALEIETESEGLIQALTCNALVNPLRWSGIYPVFVDIKDKTYNLDPADLERKITKKTRIVIAQHTFGQPAEINKIKKICEEKNLILIEDCAHSLGAEFQGQKLGTFGKAAFFSLGRSKIISSVCGGAAVTNDDQLAKKIKSFQECLPYPSFLWVFKQLLHPVLTSLIVKPLYPFFGLGRWLLILFQKTGILSKAVHKKEKAGERPGYLLQKMPNALALLALAQFKRLKQFIYNQRKIADFYRASLKDLNIIFPAETQGRIYMRFPILINNGQTGEILKKARKENIYLDDGWRLTPIVPPDTDQSKMGYFWGDCPVAERVARRILNLPTNINIDSKTAGRVVEFLKKTLISKPLP